MIENKPNILVLMSTYNGEKFIEKQINSVLNQKNVNVNLLIRDDCSKDKTIEIISRFKSDKVKIIYGKNVGATKSFFSLVDNCDDSYDYYSLCDQDDVWDENKLEIAICNLHKYKDRPALYSSNTRIVDEELNILDIEKQNPVISLGSAIVKNYVTGCTTVFNNQLLKLVKNNISDVEAKSHEWWLNLVCLSNGGKSIYDIQAHMNYRQHNNNVVGAPTSFIKKWKTRYKKFKTQQYNRDKMAEQLIKKYKKNMTEEDIKLLECVKEIKNKKIKALINRKLKTKSYLDNLCFKILIIWGKI